MNMRQILNVLSSSLYKGDVLSVATRELLQNSFDAVKKGSNPTIDVNFDYCKKKLTFVDNGIGMSPDTVKEVFLTVGGTAKEGLEETERSGGFGIAKVQFFMAASNIFINTIRDGIETIVESTQDELLSQNSRFSTHRTFEPNGTKIELTFPDTYTDCTGKTHELYYYMSSVKKVLERPLIGYNIDVRLNGTPINTPFKYKHYIKEEYDWGTVLMYYTSELSGSYMKADVHCAGLFQFIHQTYLGDNQGMQIAINILPKFPAGQREYPFANSRDDFSGYAKPDIDKMVKAIEQLAKFLHAEKVRKEYSSFGKLHYLEVNGKLHERDILGHSDEEPFDIDGFLSGCCDLSSLLKALAELAKLQADKAKKLAEQKEDGKQESLKFINKTDKTFTNKDHERFSKLASVVYDVVYEVRIREVFYKDVSTCGILIEDGVGGACLTLGGVTGIYLNPVGIHQNANHFANKMMEVLIHELAHAMRGGDYHYDSFFENIDQMRDIMWEYNLYEKYHAKFMEIYLQYNDVAYTPSSKKKSDDELPF